MTQMQATLKKNQRHQCSINNYERRGNCLLFQLITHKTIVSCNIQAIDR